MRTTLHNKSFALFKKFLNAEIMSHEFIEEEEAIGSGAEVADIQIGTAKKYLRRLCSKEGIYYVEFESKKGCKVIRFKPGFDPKLKELLKKYEQLDKLTNKSKKKK